MKVKLIGILLLLCTNWVASAQDSLYLKDVEEIKFKAELTVKQLNDVLNVISSTDADLSDIRKVIADSYTGERNRIFMSPKIVVEDDLNPTFRSSKQTKDVELSRYLNDFDLLYHKTEAPSVEFKILRISEVKKADQLYIKVYFQSLFTSRNNAVDGAYQVNNRVAELSVDKLKNKWVTQISRLGFFQAEDTLNDNANNIAIIERYNMQKLSADSVLANDARTAAMAFEDEQRKKERELLIQEEIKQLNSYNLLLSKGDAAFAEGDMAGALKRYAEAEELRPFDRLAKIKIGQTKKHIEQLKVTAEQLFQKYIDQARLMERYRNYELAKEYYTKALEQKPEEKPKFDQQLNMLDSKIRILVEFTEKYKAGLYKEAIKDFDKVIKKDPTNSDFFLGRGKCYDKLNDTKRALNDYSKAIEFDNNNLDAIYRRAILYRKLNDPYKAIADLKVYQTIDKSNLSIYLDLSDLHVQTKNNAAAIEDLDMALKINAKAAAILFAKAQLIEKEGNLKQALTVYEEVVLADSTNNPDYYFHKGKCAYQLSLIDKAAADFATARKYGLNDSYKADIASFAEEQFQVFNQAFAERKNQAALTAINNAIAINPNWAIYRFNKALVLKELNQLKESVTNFTDAVKIDELYAEAYFQRGLVLQLLQEYETSITDFKQLLTLKPDDYRGFYQMGISLFQLQQYSEVVDNILRSLILIQNSKAKIAPNIISENYNLLAKSYYNIKDFVKAREAAKNAIRNNELNAEALFYRGYANYQLNELSDAASDIKKALELQPQPFWYAILGKVYQQKEEYVYAVDAYSKALSGKPDAVLQPFFYYRGFTQSLQNNFDDAVKDYEQILQLGIDSSFENFDFELGVLYLNTSQYQQAESFLQKSLQKYPNQPLAQYKLAIVVGLQNKLDQSLELFDKSFTNKAVPYSIIKRDKQLQFIKDDKRFKALIKKWY